MVTLYHADFKILQMDAAVIHLPNPEITHHVTKISFMVYFLRVKQLYTHEIIFFNSKKNYVHKNFRNVYL